MTSTLLPSLTVQPPTVHRLENGLTIIAEQLAVEAVSLDVWLNVGSAIEPEDNNGMAHFLEHMVFKGTDRLDNGEFEALIEQRGALTNAATSQDYTHYYITTAPQDFADLAPLQMDVVFNAAIPEAGFEQERLVILEEIRRSQDHPSHRIFQSLAQVAFEQLPYRRPVLGPASTIAQLTPRQMRSFHQTWYQPRSVTAVAVGNLPVDRLIQIVEDSLPNQSFFPGATPLVAHGQPTQPTAGNPICCEQPFTKIVRREYTDAGLQQARLMMVWRVPGLDQVQSTYPLDILASVLGYGRMGRLVQDLREEQGWVAGISASNMTYLHQGIFCISAQLEVEHLDAVEARIIDHLNQLHTEPVTRAELARVRAQVANHFTFDNETPSDRASLYGYYQSLLSDLQPALKYPHAIRSVGTEDLQQAAQKYLRTDAYGIVIVKPA